VTVSLFDRVAIVTGAGVGIGRSHALMLASLGAKVVVNDLGGARDGTGQGRNAADAVVEEIRAAGGMAIANYANVADWDSAHSIVETALSEFGKLDIVVNNAGILRDRTLIKMTQEEIDAVIRVHLLGTFYVTHAAWPHLMGQKYGRIVLTSSTSGVCGNFGQSNYGAAKMGVIGMMNCIMQEGQKNNVFVNTITPGAATRMTADILSEEMQALMKPEHISPVVAYLASETCTDTGLIVNAAAGGFQRIQLFFNEGIQFDPREPVTVDMVAQGWSQLTDMTKKEPIGRGMGPVIQRNLQKLGLI